MIDPEPPPLWPPKTIPSDENYERLAAALREFSDGQWVCDFIKRLNYTMRISSERNKIRPPHIP
jgi:hypothetical protein